MNIMKPILLLIALSASSTGFAYTPEEQSKQCHKPKFTDFTLTEYKAPEQAEIAPESEFSFKVPAWTDPESIKLTAKKQPLPFTIESNTSFHKVKAKIPAEFTGKFVRLDVSAKVLEGECREITGWLLKVAEQAPAASSAVETGNTPSTAPSATVVAPNPTEVTTPPSTTPAPSNTEAEKTPSPAAVAPSTTETTQTPSTAPAPSNTEAEKTPSPAAVAPSTTETTQIPSTAPAPAPSNSKTERPANVAEIEKVLKEAGISCKIETAPAPTAN
jgi:hypothetical protein